MILEAILAAYVAVQEVYKQVLFNRSSRIYERIVQANHIVDAPKLYRDTDMSINAATDESDVGGIYMYDGILVNFFRNDDEVAMVLAHELGHWAHRGKESRYQMEYDADRFGAKAMEIAGYNRCRGALVLWRFGNTDSASHPPGDKRWLAVTEGCYGEADK